MTLYNIFNTFEEAKQAQEYDYGLFRANKFSEVTGIPVDIMLSENLHFDQNKRHVYYVQNNIDFSDEQKLLIHNVVNNFNVTNRLANIYAHNNSFVYLAFPALGSNNNTIEINDVELASLVPLNDDGICIAVTDWE